MANEIIYDVFKDGVYIGAFAAKDIRTDLSMSPASFRQAVNEGRTIRGHYKIIPVDTKIAKKDPLLIEFDLATSAILKKAGKA